MDQGLCPECGEAPGEHSEDTRFWLRASRACSLRASGVTERIEQYQQDKAEDAAKRLIWEGELVKSIETLLDVVISDWQKPVLFAIFDAQNQDKPLTVFVPRRH